MGVLGHRAGSTHCTLTRAEWKESLEASGYSDILFLSSEGDTVSHLAFVCQGDPVPIILDAVTPIPPTPALSVTPDSSRPCSEPMTPPEYETITCDHTSPYPLGLTGVIAEKSYIEHTGPLLDAITNQSQSPLPSGFDTTAGLTIVHRFVAGGEIELATLVSSTDATKSYIFWLYTDTKCNNTTLLGLARSIRHEFSLWKIYMVLFHPSWTPARQKAYIYEALIPLHWVDAEVLVDEEGCMSVPRVVMAPSPPRTELRGSNPIQFDDAHIWRAYPAGLGPDDVEVAVAYIGLSPTFPGCSEFSGYVSAVGQNITNENQIGERYAVLRSLPCNILISIQNI
jgi:fatty acid synthase